MSAPPLVSVVVPARNEEKYIEKCLDSICAQTFADIEVIVVDGESDDATPALVRAYAERDSRVRLVSNPARIIPAGMNEGLRAARGRWLVRVDAHATVPSTYVERALSHLKTDKWGGVGGRKDGVGITPAGRAIAKAMGSRFGVGNSTYHHGTEPQPVDHIPFGAYPVELARRLGGWDERLRVNQDFEFDWRVREAGEQLLFDPELRIDWVCRQSVRALWKQYLRYGRGKVRVAAMHPKSIAIRHLVPPAAVVYLALAVLLAPFRPRLAAIAIAPYLLIVAGGTVDAARGLSWRERMYLPGCFVSMHVAWGAGFLWGAAEVATSRGTMSQAQEAP